MRALKTREKQTKQEKRRGKKRELSGQIKSKRSP
jgi:hypothetical protein